MVSQELTDSEKRILFQYRDLFDSRKVWRELTWRGHSIAKIPNDLWLYQEVIFELQPGLIVEFGTNLGGSALFFANMLDMNGSGRVLSIDVKDTAGLPRHDRIDYFVGHSRAKETVELVKREVESTKGAVLFVEDSAHTPENTAGELELYAGMVTPGSYFIVEDCSWPDQSMLIHDVIAAFIRANPEFTVDHSKGKFLTTAAPGGWIKRTKEEM